MHDGDIGQTNVAVTENYKSFLISKCRQSSDEQAMELLHRRDRALTDFELF